ncbi:hypothetical protein ACFL1G_08715 [Planctomycetota bacterium]
MFKKAVIIGLVLLIAGSAALGWLFLLQRKEQRQASIFRKRHASQINEYLRQYDQWLQTPDEQREKLPWGLDKLERTKTAVQLQQEQQDRLKVDLEKLAAGEKELLPFADMLYGKDWRNELSQYKSQKELKESASIAFIICTAMGAMIVAWCLLLLTAQLVIRIFDPLCGVLTRFYKSLIRHKYPDIDEDDGQQNNDTPQQRQEREKQQRRLNKKREKALVNSGWQMPEKNCEEYPGLSCCEDASSTENEETLPQDHKPQKNESETVLSKAVEDSTNGENISEAEDEILQQQTQDFEQVTQISVQSPQNAGGSHYLSVNSFAEKQSATAVQQATLEYTEPIGHTLKELTQQVSAIREVACCQQDKVKKLQGAYDWKIIRGFSLRIIRCVDNLENRLQKFPKKGADTKYLKEIRDELIFALESSGIEQFKPELNGEYHGLQKTTEVVKEKETTDEPELEGKIAKIIRPGYRYVIDENNVKVVRTAQVKLFG